MRVEIDVRGKPCPQPVLQARKAMQSSEDVRVLVSSPDQVDNVRRMAERSGWSVKVQALSGHYAIHLESGGTQGDIQVTPEDLTCGLSEGSESSAKKEKRVLVIRSEKMGSGSDELGEILMRAFINTLREVEPLPDVMIFYNSGVLLTIEGSKVLPDLLEIESSGVEMLVCGTCLDFYDVGSRRRVGVVSNMFDIASTIMASGHRVRYV